MPHDDGAFDTEQRRAAVGVRRHLLFKRAKRALHEQRPHFGKRRGHERGLQVPHERLGRALDGLQADVAGEPVGDHHVEVARHEVAPLAVSGEGGDGLGQQTVGLLGEQVSLGVLLADIQKTDLRALHPHDGVHVHLAHLGELHEVLRLAVGVGSHVDEQGRTGPSRNDLAQGRALHAFDAPDDERGRGQAGAGGTGGEEAIGGALLHEPAAHDDGGVLLGAHGAGRMLPHLDDLGGHLRRRPIVNGGEGLHLLGRPDEREPQVGIGLKGLQGTAQHHGRAAVTAHDVHGDCYWFCHVAYLLKTMRRPGRQGLSLHGHCASGPIRTACGHGRRHGPIAKKPPGRPGLSSLACEEALPTSRRLPGASATVTHKSYSVSMTSRSR